VGKDDYGFGVTADVNPGLAGEAGVREAIERGADRYGHGAGPPDARAGGRKGICGQCESDSW